jgi:hypothetical protein
LPLPLLLLLPLLLQLYSLLGLHLFHTLLLRKTTLLIVQILNQLYNQTGQVVIFLHLRN